MKYTDDMKTKIALEYYNARKKDKKGIATKYQVSTSACANWVRLYLVDADVEETPKERSLNE